MKLLTAILVSSLLALSLNANKLDEYLKKLTPSQATILMDTYERSKEYNLKWTMTAIAWQESGFGKRLIGRTTPDYGIFQININTFKARYRKVVKDGKMTDKDIIKMLISDHELNYFASIEEIKFWQNVHGDDYEKIWASYNGGWKGNPRYARAIKIKIQALKRYFALQG